MIVHSDTIWGTNVGECRAKADESNAQMLEQNEITENAILVASRASDDWAQARMKADLEILCVEELEESHSRLCAARDTAQEQLERRNGLSIFFRKRRMRRWQQMQRWQRSKRPARPSKSRRQNLTSR